MSQVIKRHGHQQEFDEKKVYASVYAACLNAHVAEEESENIAQDVTGEIKVWIKDRGETTSVEIFDQVTKRLSRLNKEASFMYCTHRDVS